MTVPDHVVDIACVVNECHAEYDAVVVTGGLGPVYDGVTMESVAVALERSLERNANIEEWPETNSDYPTADLVEGTTNLPAGSRMLPNDESVAPDTVVGSVYVLPGVSSEMKAMFARVANKLTGE